MSEGYNKWTGVGNLCSDPELRMTSGGKAVLKLRLACNEKYKDNAGNWKDKTEYVSVTVWGARAEGLAKFLEKGNQVFVEGSLRTSSYDDRDGNKRYRTEVQCLNLIVCGSRGSGGGKSKPRAHNDDAIQPSGDGADWDDLPF